MQRATMLVSSPQAASLATTRLAKQSSSLPSARRCLAPVPYRRTSLRVSAQKGDDTPFQASDSTLAPSFTRRRERAVGRVAMLGVAAAWIGETLTGLGPMSQLASELGISTNIAYGATAILATWQLFLGVNQFNPTWSAENQKDVGRRSKGITGITAIEPDADSRIKPTQEPGKFLLRNELVLGRAAMLIFAGAMVLEYVWRGESPLAHIGLITPGVPLSMAPLWLKFGISIFAIGGLGFLSGFDTNKDPDTY